MAAAKKQARKPTRRHKASKTPKSKSQKASKPSKAGKFSNAKKPSKAKKQQKPPNVASVTIRIVAPGIVSAGQECFPGVADNTQFFFNNSSTLDLNLNFTGSFGNLAAPHGQTVGPISASGTAISYTITNAVGKVTGGPYAIQWDNGILEITIDSNTPDFDPVDVVPLGLIHFTAIGADYTIKWQNQNGQQVTVWSPQPTVIYETPTSNPIQHARPGVNGPFQYDLTAKGEVVGGGTVKVGS